jgi:hypothetical protein
MSPGRKDWRTKDDQHVPLLVAHRVIWTDVQRPIDSLLGSRGRQAAPHALTNGISSHCVV